MSVRADLTLEHWPVWREFRTAFRQATGIWLALEPVSPTDTMLCVPVIVGGQRVAELRGRGGRKHVRLIRLFLRLTAPELERHLMANGHLDPGWLQLAKQYLADHVGDELTVAIVARQVHYSAEYFRKRFRELTGLSFGEFVTRLRVAQAKELIGNSDRRITEVAFAAGFQSIPSFNRSFKQFTGLAPTAYRAALRGGGRPPKSEQRKVAHE